MWGKIENTFSDFCKRNKGAKHEQKRSFSSIYLFFLFKEVLFTAILLLESTKEEVNPLLNHNTAPNRNQKPPAKN